MDIEERIARAVADERERCAKALWEKNGPLVFTTVTVRGKRICDEEKQDTFFSQAEVVRMLERVETAIRAGGSND